MRAAALACILLAWGCTDKRMAASHTLKTIAEAGRQAHDYTLLQCGKSGKRVVEKCRNEGDKDCKAFQRCFTTVKLLHALQTSVLAGKLAVAVGDTDQKVQAAIRVSLKLLGRVRQALEVWGIKAF